MLERDELDGYLAELLDTASFDDYCVNGLQVEGRSEIRKVITGVSVSQGLFSEAISRKADAVIIHHGLFWKNSPHPMALTGVLRDRVKMLLDHDINLFGYHLPLDVHPELGNNALIARALEIDDPEFVPIEGSPIPMASVGELPSSMLFEDFIKHTDEILNTHGVGLSFGAREVKRVFILSGGGGGYFLGAYRSGADVMVTGTLREDGVRIAEELGLSLYAAGHYNSEKWGIRALGEHLKEKFNLDVDFIDVPNPI